jgi:hypothetical protein
MSQKIWRQPTPRERRLIEKLLSVDFPGRDDLRGQMESAEVSDIDDVGSLHFLVSGPPASVASRVATEAYYYDKEADDFDPAVHVLLHVVDGKLHELEVYKDDGSSIKRLPKDIDLADLRFY